MHVDFDYGFINWIIFCHLVYSQFRPRLNKTILFFLRRVEIVGENKSPW